MKLPIITSLALATAMLAGPAMAQTAIAGGTVTAEELPYVQAQCDTLARVDSTATAADAGAQKTKDDDKADDKANDDSADKAADSAAPPEASKQLVSSIDLSLLTLEDCKTAGLVK